MHGLTGSVRSPFDLRLRCVPISLIMAYYHWSPLIKENNVLTCRCASCNVNSQDVQNVISDTNLYLPLLNVDIFVSPAVSRCDTKGSHLHRLYVRLSVRLSVCLSLCLSVRPSHFYRPPFYFAITQVQLKLLK